MLNEPIRKVDRTDIFEKEKNVFKKISPDIYSYFEDNEELWNELFKLDIETFLYVNLLNVDINLFEEKVNQLAEKYDIVDTAYENDNLKIYPKFLLKYVYINMKKFEKENK